MNKRSAIVNYIISCVSIAFFSCSLLGFLVVNMMVEDYNEAVEQANMNRCQLAVTDLTRQIDVMRGIAYDVSLKTAYRSMRLKKNTWYEMNFLDELKMRDNRLALRCEFFLYPLDEGQIYRGVGSKLPCDVFFGDILREETPREWLEQTNTGFRTLDMKEHLLFSWPIRLDLENGKSELAMFAFALPKGALRLRLEEMAGATEHGFLLWLDDGAPVVLGDEALLTDENIRKIPLAHNVSDIILGASVPGQYFTLGNALRFIDPIIAIGGATLILALAVYIAWRIYAPIRRLEQKIVMPRNRNTRNELANIESMFDELARDSEASRQELHERYAQLRQEILMRLLHGHDSDALRVRGQIAGIQLQRGKYFGVLSLYLSTGGAGRTAELFKAVEQLSGESLWFYCAANENDASHIYVLVAALEQWMSADAAEMVDALLNEEEIKAQIGVGSLQNSLNKLPISMLEADVALHPGRDANAEMEQRLKEMSLRLQGDVEQGDAAQARLTLSGFLAELPDNSAMLSLYMRAKLIGELIRLAEAIEGTETIIASLTSLSLVRNEQTFYEELYDLLDQLCLSVSARLESRKSALVTRALSLMEEQCCLPNTSLESIARELNMNGSYLSRIIKESTGKNYKDHIFDLRMAQAVRLLRDTDLSISEVSARVGFLTVSSFIVRLRETYGMTPAKYRAWLRAQAR